MANISDVPDEILIQIFKYLDYFALLNVSKTCRRFERFYSEPQVVRKIHFDGRNAWDVQWTDIKLFFKLCKIHITHLDISYVHWVPLGELKGCLKMLINLRHLNVIETNMRLSHVKEIVDKNTLLKSIALSYTSDDSATAVRRAVFLKVDHIHFFVRPCQFREVMTHYFRKDVTEITSIKIELAEAYQNHEIFFSHFWRRLLDLGFKRYILTNAYPCTGLGKDQVLLQLYSFVYRNENEPVTHHMCIETHGGIFLSSDICADIVDNDFVKHHFSCFTMRQHYYREMFTVYICKAEEEEKRLLEEYVRKRLRIRMWEHCFLRRYYCFLEDHVPLVEYFIHKKSLKRLCLDETHLGILAETTQQNLPLFKKLRTSRIPQVPKDKKNVFRKMIESNPNLEALKIVSNGCNDCYVEDHLHPQLVLDTSSLLQITNLKYLKFLSLTIIPEQSRNFFHQIFITCKLLEYLGVFVYVGFHYYAESLAEEIHLCNNLKVLRVHCEIRMTDMLLENLAQCTTLEVIDAVERSSITRRKQLMSLLQLLRLTKPVTKLRFLNIEQRNLTEKDTTLYKTFEKVIRSKNEYIYVNFTQTLRHTFFRMSGYNFDTSVM